MNTAKFMIPPREATHGLAAEASRYAPWFHNVHLADGSETAPEHPLGDFPSCIWTQLQSHLPDDLEGWTALDVGCNSGFYSIELARRGAEVTAVEPDPHFLAQARWMVRQNGLEGRIHFLDWGVYELVRLGMTYDLVFFMGVFYHLRHPLLALDILSRMTRRLMVFQTLSMPGAEVVPPVADLDFNERSAMLDEGWPKMAFIERSLAGDPTNWWAPNHACIEAMLRSCGLHVTARPGHEIYLCEPDMHFPDEMKKRNQAELSAATGWIPDESGLPLC